MSKVDLARCSEAGQSSRYVLRGLAGSSQRWTCPRCRYCRHFDSCDSHRQDFGDHVRCPFLHTLLQMLLLLLQEENEQERPTSWTQGSTERDNGCVCVCRFGLIERKRKGRC